MNHLRSFFSKYPVWSALILAIIGFVLIVVFSGIASSASLFLMSAIFAALHMPQIFISEVSILLALLFFFETVFIPFWWGAIVLKGGSIWPAFMLYFQGNAVVALQGYSSSRIEPDIQVYMRLFIFSIPLGIISIGILLKNIKISDS